MHKNYAFTSIGVESGIIRAFSKSCAEAPLKVVFDVNILDSSTEKLSYVYS
jgi:hypothetical protein